MYVHVFGAYFGLAVAKALHHEDLENEKESTIYHSDIFSMIGTLFLWLFWPSFNSATAVDEGQTRAIINTLLSIASSCISTFILSTFIGRGRLNMVSFYKQGYFEYIIIYFSCSGSHSKRNISRWCCSWYCC